MFRRERQVVKLAQVRGFRFSSRSEFETPIRLLSLFVKVCILLFFKFTHIIESGPEGRDG